MAITKHVYQIFIKATPEQVWDTIIEPSWTRRYFHGTRVRFAASEGSAVSNEHRRWTTGGRRDDRGDGAAQSVGHDMAHAVRRGDVRGTAEPGRVDRRRRWATA